MDLITGYTSDTDGCRKYCHPISVTPPSWRHFPVPARCRRYEACHDILQSSAKSVTSSQPPGRPLHPVDRDLDDHLVNRPVGTHRRMGVFRKVNPKAPRRYGHPGVRGVKEELKILLLVVGLLGLTTCGGRLPTD